MSLGRTSTFLDVYLQRALEEGILDETRAQELIDDFLIKLPIVRFLRPPGVRRAVLRRSDVGDGVHWRHRP
jgi:pyruvate-formate lyase